MDRRSFLKALVGLGAAIALPAHATEAQVDVVWHRLAERPFLFAVNSFGTIVEPESAAPTLNSDVYESISTRWIDTPESVVRAVQEYAELESHFAELATDELFEAQDRLECNEGVSLAERVALERTVALLQRPDHDWPGWVQAMGQAGLPRFVAAIERWLDEPVNWRMTEFWPSDWSSQGKALQFFQQVDDDTLDAIGVVIVEGQHPGSTYYAAELRSPVYKANTAAEALGLPFRFSIS